jgi:hypothetical protein
MDAKRWTYLNFESGEPEYTETDNSKHMIGLTK